MERALKILKLDLAIVEMLLVWLSGTKVDGCGRKRGRRSGVSWEGKISRNERIGEEMARGRVLTEAEGSKQ